MEKLTEAFEVVVAVVVWSAIILLITSNVMQLMKG